MSRIAGVVPAIVKNLDDPMRLGRIQVGFDWMEDEPQSYWARVAAPMAGPERGLFFMPEKGDEVLVSFDHGDSSHPYVIGYCWSKSDEPPYGADLEKRGITTVKGHQLTFNDTDQASPTIELSTSSGYALKLDESSSGAKISLATPDGVAIELDAMSSPAGPQIKLTLPTGNSIELGPTGLTINVAAGIVNVTALSATITAPAVTIDAAVTTVSGVLTVGGALIASSIVSPAYTPGVGNLI